MHALSDAAPEDPEQKWLREVYQPNEINLTIRAVVGGMLLGCALCLSNVYVFFKTGWSMGVTLTACILAFALFEGLFKARLVKNRLGILENNALTTVASGAGFMTGGGNMAALGALLMVTSVRPPAVPLMLWFGVIAALGVFAAIPIKRQLINQEKLPFPTGTATAVLATIAAALNNRPRKRLGYLTPAEVLANLQAKDQGVATID